MKPQVIESYAFHIEWWPGDDPRASFTARYVDGTYKVVPNIEVGPFDNIAEIMRLASKQVDEQLRLW